MTFSRLLPSILTPALLAGVTWWISAPLALAEPVATTPAALDFFEKKVRPILVSNCYSCHSADTKPAGDLRVDDRRGLLHGGANGPAVVPGKGKDSLLVKRITHADEKRRMPAESPALEEQQVADLVRWIDDGAAWPALAIPSDLGKGKPGYEKLKREHWAWQPLNAAPIPNVQDGAWPVDDVDRFVLAGLEARQLRPAGEADRVTLIRRLTFDLTGLPPTLAEIDAFVADSSAEAIAKVVDRLLASPRYGERWGRHWLDVARYGESTGPSRNIPYPLAWKYRDYVIAAVQADVPYDRFIQEQIAGDLLPALSDDERNRLLTATGFLSLGVKDVNQRFKTRFIMDNVDEQIDVVTRSVLGLTVSCARCHDHKFDPVPTTDYYALAGIFTSTDNCAGVRNKMGGSGLAYYDPSMLVALSGGLAKPSPEKVKELEAKVAETKAAWDKIRGTPEGLAKAAGGRPKQYQFRIRFEQAQAELLALSDPARRGFAVHGVRDAKMIGDTEIRLRGEAEKLGPKVPRGFLSTVSVPEAPAINPSQSGRLELAQWLTSPNNPLAARVYVNRVWRHLMGRGIVSTVDNFGVMGDVPSHPELLDYLAGRFVREGWSTKRLIRSFVLSRTYRLSAEAPADLRAADPSNRLFGRYVPRRLDTEEIRDGMLAAAGVLDFQVPEGSPVKELRMVEMQDNGREATQVGSKADRSLHRSVYLPALRGVVPRVIEAFDPVEQTLVTGARESTNVPSQALFLLNSEFVHKQSLALAKRLLDDASLDDRGRLERAYRITLGRSPRPEEVERAETFVSDYALAIAPQFSGKEHDELAGAEKPLGADVATASPEPPEDADDPDVTPVVVAKDEVKPKNARTAAWLALTQALFGSAEFRYVR